MGKYIVLLKSSSGTLSTPEVEGNNMQGALLAAKKKFPSFTILGVAPKNDYGETLYPIIEVPAVEASFRVNSGGYLRVEDIV